MRPAEKAYYNAQYDRNMTFRDDLLSRKPGSTKAQREALKARIAERKANGTLGKVPFVLEAVTAPYVGVCGKWCVSLTYSDGIVNRVPEMCFTGKTEAQGFYAEAMNHIGQTQEEAMLGGAR